MARKNDFLFIDTEHFGYGSVSRYVVIAGGRIRLPLWLLWATWGVIVGVIWLFETVMAFVNGTMKEGPPWFITGWLIAVTVVGLALFWAFVGLRFLVNEWRDALKGRN